MQSIAAEMNLSETAFVSTKDAPHDFTSAKVWSIEDSLDLHSRSLRQHSFFLSDSIVFLSLCMSLPLPQASCLCLYLCRFFNLLNFLSFFSSTSSFSSSTSSSLLNPCSFIPPTQRFQLRWFTPTTEVALCGHATLAAAAVAFKTGNENDVIEFETKSGVLKAQKGDGLMEAASSSSSLSSSSSSSSSSMT